jgi:hypothetical protein
MTIRISQDDVIDMRRRLDPYFKHALGRIGTVPTQKIAQI